MHVLLALCAAAAAPDDAQADLRDLAEFLEHVHPYIDAPLDLPSQIDPTPAGVTRAAAEMTSAIGDGHIDVGWAAGMSRSQFLPVRPAWTDDRAVIAAGPPELVGRELVAIDGYSVASLRTQMNALASVDGARSEPVQAALLADPWRLLHLVIPPADAYVLTLAPDEQVTVAATADVRTLVRPTARMPSWTHDPTRTILSVPAMNAAPEFETIIEQGFAELQTDELVIDLRGNAGGFHDRGVWIAAHLVDGPFQQWSASSMHVSRVPRRLRQHVSVPFGLPADSTLRSLARGAEWHREGDPGAPVMQPREPRYTGPVTVWVDGLTESAAIELAVSLKHARPDVRIVGEPTAGACDGHMGEQPVLFTTPRFQVPILISLQRIELVPIDGCVPGQGLPLDEHIPWSSQAVHALFP